MLIVWGKRAVHDELGFVADFCPVCRALRAFRFRRLGSASHVYFVSIPGEDSLIGYTRTCMECESTFGAVPDTYSSTSQHLLPVETLRAQTFPNYFEAYGSLIALERKMASELTPKERRYRIEEPFVAIAEMAQPRLSHIKMDRGAWYSVGAALFLYLGVPGILHAAAVDVDAQPALMLGPFLAALVVLFVGLGLSGRRYAVSWALPRLARSVAVLRPTDSELEEVLRELRNRELKLGSRLRVPELQQAIERSRNACER